MRRRVFITTAAVGLAWPRLGRAQQAGRIPRIGVLVPGEPPRDVFDAFITGLRDLGYEDGKSIRLDVRWSGGGESTERWIALAKELVAANVALILSGTTNATMVVRRLTTTVPIVAVSLVDPIRLGIIQGYARPGGNVTGLQLITSELIEKRLQLTREAIPGLKYLAIVAPAGETASYQTETAQAAAEAVGLRTSTRSVETLEALEQVIVEARAARADALMLMQGAFFRIHRERIAIMARQASLPAVSGETGFAAAGGLMNYGADIPENWRRGTVYVDKILKGANPAELPIEQPARYEFIINARTAKDLGLELPLALLARADEVIE